MGNFEPEQVNDAPESPRLDLAQVQAKLAGKSGRKYWRSLEEVAETPEFQQWVDDEFPNRSSLMNINRRDLLKFMAAGMALAGLTGCRSVFLGQEKVIPYVKQPEELVPGVPLFYASSLPLHGFGVGVLVEQHEGRPTKLEGNPDHPASLGALDSITQAEILNLYDPERAGSVLERGDISTWELFQSRFLPVLRESKNVRVLTGAVTSPSLKDQIDRFVRKYNATWHTYEPISRSNIYNGTRLIVGSPMDVTYKLENADVILTLDADLFAPERTVGAFRYARDFGNRRRVAGPRGEMNRLYAIESVVTPTGASADHRFAVKASQIGQVASALAALLGVPGAENPGNLPFREGVLEAIAKDLLNHRKRSIVVAGENQPAEVHALVHLINLTLENFGETFELREIADEAFKSAKGLRELTDDMAAGNVDTLLILGGNPVFNAPADYKFAEQLAKVKHTVHLTHDSNETSALVEWELPMAHGLETWGDLRAFDGTVSIQQPLIAPLFQGRSSLEVLSLLNGQPKAGYDIVKAYWRSTLRAGAAFENRWRELLHDGLVKGSAFPAAVVGVERTSADGLRLPTPSTEFEIVFLPDARILDGRHANNGWLMELPSPLTKLTWDNAAVMSIKTAEKLGVVTNDLVRVTVGEAQLILPAFIQPGQAEGTIALHLGFGRERGGSVATVSGDDGGGFNVYPLRTSTGMNITTGSVEKAGGSYFVVTTQGHNPLGGDTIDDERDILRMATLQQYNRDPEELVPFYAFPEYEIKKNNLYVEEVFEWNGERWGMTIDLNTCIGCNACVTACQSENNIPTVGKIQVGKSREMHWLRIDRYYAGDEDTGIETTWQPVMCVHCEKAPCEPVCPVAATVHSHDGLNQMVYNRCVGTRYCSNNCPYKVRRFNYLNYTDNQPNFSNVVWQNSRIPGPIHEPKNNGIELLKMINNPNVTVRGRGVMEKCTYCVQRINDARKEAKKGGTTIKDGDIITACQQACPTQAIIFGDLADKESRVAKMYNDPRAWLLLEELQTRPRTAHLAKLRNVNPEITPIPEPDPRKELQKKNKEKHHGGDHKEGSHGGDHASGDHAGGDHAGHDHSAGDHSGETTAAGAN